MEEIQKLRLQEKILLSKLRAVREEISILETFQIATTVSNEPEGESLESKPTPDQTGSGKEKSIPLMADVLPKSIRKDSSDPSSLSKPEKPVILAKDKNLVICETSSSNESQTSPVQTVTGKDNSNPLSPVALGKSKLVDLKTNTNINLRLICTF